MRTAHGRTSHFGVTWPTRRGRVKSKGTWSGKVRQRPPAQIASEFHRHARPRSTRREVKPQPPGGAWTWEPGRRQPCHPERVPKGRDNGNRE